MMQFPVKRAGAIFPQASYDQFPPSPWRDGNGLTKLEGKVPWHDSSHYADWRVPNDDLSFLTIFQHLLWEVQIPHHREPLATGCYLTSSEVELHRFTSVPVLSHPASIRTTHRLPLLRGQQLRKLISVLLQRLSKSQYLLPPLLNAGARPRLERDLGRLNGIVDVLLRRHGNLEIWLLGRGVDAMTGLGGGRELSIDHILEGVELELGIISSTIGAVRCRGSHSDFLCIKFPVQFLGFEISASSRVSPKEMGSTPLQVPVDN